jgi:hypothetical protein
LIPAALFKYWLNSQYARYKGILIRANALREQGATAGRGSTYVGARTGARVLSGDIRRGTGETIRAVIWNSDLRRFTAASEYLERDELLLVLILQHTEFRQTKTIQLKLDELLRTMERARTDLVRLEAKPDEHIESLNQEFEQLQEHVSKPQPDSSESG